jgi:hypothetical protein
LGIINFIITKIFKAQPLESDAFDRLAEAMKVKSILKKEKLQRYYTSQTLPLPCISYSDTLVFNARYYSTLLPDEALAIGAHEFNHIIKKHVNKRLPRTVLPAFLTALLMGCIFVLNPNLVIPFLFQGATGFLIFAGFAVTFSFLLALIACLHVNAEWLRQQETECDMNAVDYGYGPAMISALTNLRNRYPNSKWVTRANKLLPQTYPIIDQRIKDIELAIVLKNRAVSIKRNSEED